MSNPIKDKCARPIALPVCLDDKLACIGHFVWGWGWMDFNTFDCSAKNNYTH